MARPLRIEYPGAGYHVVNRGNQRGIVFHDDWHYELFVDKLEYFATEFNVVVRAYCCMPNHFHMYLCTPDGNLSRFMQSFLTSFCVSSNKKRRTSGHIFQGRFKSHLVEDEAYRSRLSRYIHLNPVRTRQFRDIELERRRSYLRDYKWSSYRVYLGTVKKPKWLDRRRILSHWGKRLTDQMQSYAAYVEEGLLKEVDNPFNDIVEQSILGSDRFIDKIKREYLLLRTGLRRDEPALVHLQQSYDVDEIIRLVAVYYDTAPDSVVTRRSGLREARRIAMYLVSVYCRGRYSLSELSSRFSVSASALTQARNKISNDESPSIRRALNQLREDLRKT